MGVAMKKSAFIKTAYFILLASFFVVLLFAFFEIFTIKHFNSQIEEIYKSYINSSGSYWADQFYVANKELKSMINKDANTDYNLICNSDDLEFIEDRVVDLQQDLTNMSIIHDSRIVFFVFIPDKDIMLQSVSYVNYFQGDELEELKTYIYSTEVNNSAEWKDVTLGNDVYFLHMYEHNGGYSGCYISCENVLKEFILENQRCNVYILNMDDSFFYGEQEIYNFVRSFICTRTIRMINKKICIEIPYEDILNSDSYIFLIITIAIAASIMIIWFTIIYQDRAFFKPLTKLKKAMEEFSMGNRDVWLDERLEHNEIMILNRTFNRMKEQIVKLNMDIYAAEIENQKIYNQFLRVQIQPHFYTNILNLIYTLASVQDYKTIQKLTSYMMEYFRYLLSLKGDFVYLEEELLFLDRYVQVQKIRYQGNFHLKIVCDVDTQNKKIPPLLIQTFVENSIKHNIMIVQDLEILLMIKENNDELDIIIQDNGLGFREEIVNRLNRGEDIEEDGKHIGIVNVKKRLQIIYQGRASLVINNLSKGVEVFIRIPMISEGEENEYFTCG